MSFEYIILLASVVVFGLVVFGVGIGGVWVFVKGGLSRARVKAAAPLREHFATTTLRAQMAPTLADLVEQHVAAAEAEKAAAKRKADLDAKLAGLLSDPKEQPAA